MKVGKGDSEQGSEKISRRKPISVVGHPEEEHQGVQTAMV